MRSVVVYESMYGNTHRVAELIGEGLAGFGDVSVVPVGNATRELLAGAELVVVGGPTHAHGMSHESTRAAAVEALDEQADLAMDPDAAGDGVREWLEGLGTLDAKGAAFDTRVDIPAVLSGRASKGIAKRLARHGLDVAIPPESFLVTKESHLEPGEEERAAAWGRELGEVVTGARVE